MSRELFRSMTYENGNVFTRQCSSNVNPKQYEKMIHPGFSRLYQKMGERDFEKWFITNCLMTGAVEILSGSNSTLRKLNYLSNLLWNDDKYNSLRNSLDNFRERIMCESPENQKILKQQCQEYSQNIEIYISSFYDKHFQRDKNKNER